MADALKAVVLAERLLQVSTDDREARLPLLPTRERARYVDAAAVALALLDPGRQPAPLYVAAHRLVDLGRQTPTQRRGLVQMVTDAVERYLEALAGHHADTAAHLAPVIAIDQRQTGLPEGVL